MQNFDILHQNVDNINLLIERFAKQHNLNINSGYKQYDYYQWKLDKLDNLKNKLGLLILARLTDENKVVLQIYGRLMPSNKELKMVRLHLFDDSQNTDNKTIMESLENSLTKVYNWVEEMR